MTSGRCDPHGPCHWLTNGQPLADSRWHLARWDGVIVMHKDLMYDWSLETTEFTAQPLCERVSITIYMHLDHIIGLNEISKKTKLSQSFHIQYHLCTKYPNEISS